MNYVRGMIGLSVCCAFAMAGTTGVRGGTNAEPMLLGEVKMLLEKSAQGGAAYEEAQRELHDLPPKETVSAIMEMLDDPAIVGRADVRALAYEVLLHHDGAMNATVRSTLIACLSDPAGRVVAVCCKGLDPETRRIELDARVSVLNDSAAANQNKERVLKELARWGTCASPAIGAVEEVLRNTDEDARARSLAAGAMLDMSGLDGATARFKNLDSRAKKAALVQLSRYIEEKTSYGDGLSPQDTASIPAALDLCVGALDSVDTETRKRALGAFWRLFGYACYSNRTHDAYGLRGAHRAVLEHVAREDVDKEIRQQAAELLVPDLCERFAEEHTRRRERRQRSEKEN